MMKAVSILGVAVVLAATGAAAQSEHNRSVHYADLNLQTPDGVAALERRVDRAARNICDTAPLATSIALENERNACMAETVAGSKDLINAAVRLQRAQMVQTANAQ